MCLAPSLTQDLVSSLLCGRPMSPGSEKSLRAVIPSCINCLSNCCDNMPKRSNLRKKGVTLVYSRPQWGDGEGTAGESEAASHTVPTLRKKRVVNAGISFAFSFLFNPGHQSMGCYVRKGRQ